MKEVCRFSASESIDLMLDCTGFWSLFAILAGRIMSFALLLRIEKVLKNPKINGSREKMEENESSCGLLKMQSAAVA